MQVAHLQLSGLQRKVAAVLNLIRQFPNDRLHVVKLRRAARQLSAHRLGVRQRRLSIAGGDVRFALPPRCPRLGFRKARTRSCSRRELFPLPRQLLFQLPDLLPELLGLDSGHKTSGQWQSTHRKHFGRALPAGTLVRKPIHGRQSPQIIEARRSGTHVTLCVPLTPLMLRSDIVQVCLRGLVRGRTAGDELLLEH
jgi:hypothetical protein